MAPYLDVNVYMPDNLMGDFYLSFIGYFNRRMYFGIRSVSNDAQYYGTTEEFTQPVSGVKTYGFIFNNSNFIYANITIDWSLYSSFVNDNDVVKVYSNIHINPKPLSALSKIIGEGIRIEEGNINTYTLTNLSLIGDNVPIYVYNQTARFVFNGNVSVSGIRFVYKGTGAISSRETWNDGHGNHRLVPLVTAQDIEDDNIGIIGQDVSFITIAENSGQCSVENCVFEAFPNIVIFNMSNGRHLNGNHSVITNNEFIRCRIGVYQAEEFCRFAENTFQGCVFGVIPVVSDIIITSCKIMQCDVGIYIRKGANDTDPEIYGYVNGSSLVHCGIASLYAHYITQIGGFSVSDCQIAQAPVICKIAYALSVVNCRLDTYFIIDAGAKSRIVANSMRHVYADVDSISNIYDVPGDTQITLNRASTASEADSYYNWQ